MCLHPTANPRSPHRAPAYAPRRFSSRPVARSRPTRCRRLRARRTLRLLSAVIASKAKVELPSGHGEAMVVLRAALVRERTQGRAAARVQRKWRAHYDAHRDTLIRHTRAALPLQCAVRRALARRDAAARSERAHSESAAAAKLQGGARGAAARREAGSRRAGRGAAATLQAAARGRAARRQFGESHDAAVKLQAAARRKAAGTERRARARAALLAVETPEQASVREERERKELLREKLKKRRAREQAAAQASS